MLNLLITVISAYTAICHSPQCEKVKLSDFAQETIEYYIDKGFHQEDGYITVSYGSMGYNTFSDGKWSQYPVGLLEIWSSDSIPDKVPTITIKGVTVGFYESCASNPFFSLHKRKSKIRNDKSENIGDVDIDQLIQYDPLQQEFEIVDYELLSEMWRFCFNEDGTFNPFLSNTYFGHENDPTDFSSVMEIVGRYFSISGPTETDMKLYYPYPDNEARPIIGDDALNEFIHENFEFDSKEETISIILLVDEIGNASILSSSIQPYDLSRHQALRSLGEKLCGLKFYPASFRGYDVRSVYNVELPGNPDKRNRVPVQLHMNRGMEF